MGSHTENSTWQKMAWFVGLWLAGVATISLVGFIIRFWLIG